MTNIPTKRSTADACLSRLLDREIPQEYLRERTAHVAAKQTVLEAATRSVLIFRVGMEWLGLPTDRFQEVSEQSTIRTLPHRGGGTLRGLVNVRGDLVVCVSLEALLGLERITETRGSAPGRLLICSPPGGRLAFTVSEVHGVHHYRPTELKPPPATLAKAAGIYIAGILPWKDKTVGCLDDELLFYGFDKGLA